MLAAPVKVHALNEAMKADAPTSHHVICPPPRKKSLAFLLKLRKNHPIPAMKTK